MTILHATVNALRGRLRPPAHEWRAEIGKVPALLLVTPLTLALLVFFVWPLVRLVIMSLTEPTVGLDNYEEFFTSPLLTRALIKTYRISLIVTVVAIVLGSLFAWELRSTRSRLKRFVLWAAVLLPLWMSTIIRNYAFTILLQRKGIINDTLLWLGVVDEPVKLLYTEFAVFAGILYYMLPYAVLPLFATFLQIDEDLLLAAESLGASRPRAFASVVIPLAIPGFLATGIIVFVVSIGFYITPLLLGGPSAQFIANVVSTQIFNIYDLPGATATSVLLVASAILCVAAAWRAVGFDRIRRTLA